MIRAMLLVLTLVSLSWSGSLERLAGTGRFFPTLSIVAADSAGHQLGVITASMATGADRAFQFGYADTVAGVVQGTPNPRFQNDLIAGIRAGGDPVEVTRQLIRQDFAGDYRQYLLIDNQGRVTTRGGQELLPLSRQLVATKTGAAGYGLPRSVSLSAIVRQLQQNDTLQLARRLVDAITSGWIPEFRTVALRIWQPGAGLDGVNQLLVDLRVDGTGDLPAQLLSLVQHWQATDLVKRALHCLPAETTTAQALLGLALDLDPDYTDALVQLARLQLDMNPELALQHLQRAAELSPLVRHEIRQDPLWPDEIRRQIHP